MNQKRLTMFKGNKKGLAYTQEWSCTCNGCGKKYIYGDENSPVVYPKVWRSILTYWGISEEEEHRRNEEYIGLYKKWSNMVDGSEKQNLFEEMREPKYHTQFCTECMAQALHRPLEKSDVDVHIPYNSVFFNKFEERAE